VPELRAPVSPADPLGAEARKWLGEPTEEIRAAVEEKQRFIAAVPRSWPADQREWESLRGAIAPALALFGDVAQALDTAGIPAEPGYLGIGEATLRATFRHATRLRARYTVVDFLESQGVLEAALNRSLAPPAGPDP
jgi:hypothetical protein